MVDASISKDSMINQLVINSFSTNNIGLLFGRMGYALTLFCLSRSIRTFQSCIYEKYACDILNDVLQSVPKNHSFDFANGLCGIGWGVEYLLKQHYIEGNSLEVCKELDEEIMKVNPKRLDDELYCGLKGLLHYILLHLSNCSLEINKEPFDNQFLKDVYDAVYERSYNTKDKALAKLCKQYIDYYNKQCINYDYDVNICFEDDNSINMGFDGTYSLANGLCKQIILGCKNESFYFDGSL